MTKGELFAGVRNDNVGLTEPNEVSQIRGVIATVIDNMERFKANPHPDVERLVSAAQSKFEEACMLAVKAYYLSKEQ